MFYYLSQFKSIFSPLNVLGYITFRSGGSVLTAFILTLFCAPAFIRFVRRIRITQTIRAEGPQTHQAKSGTPIMGGVLILFSTVFSTLLWARLDNRFVWICLAAVIYLGFIGWMDDYRKWKGRREGLTPAQKIAAQMALAIGIAAVLYIHPPNASFKTLINIPYFKSLFLDMGVFYVFFAIMVMIGSSNAVNLTDGLDGLAVGSFVIACLTFLIFTYLAGHANFSTYLRIIPVHGVGEVSVFLAALIGSGLGFLWHNAHPAEIFMGDSGSLFMGGALGVVALIIKQELILIVVGGLFVIEALSVLIQVVSFRKFGRRIFKMAPLHHHFELSGWPEPKVTVRFWIISVILSLIALASLKLR